MIYHKGSKAPACFMCFFVRGEQCYIINTCKTNWVEELIIAKIDYFPCFRIWSYQIFETIEKPSFSDLDFDSNWLLLSSNNWTSLNIASTFFQWLTRRLTCTVPVPLTVIALSFPTVTLPLLKERQIKISWWKTYVPMYRSLESGCGSKIKRSRCQW